MESAAGDIECEYVVVTADEAETRAVGALLGRAARALAPTGVVIVLHGDLGAGKTVFVKGLAEGLALARGAAVVSPTFTIARSYPVPGVALELHHLDAYRLAGADDLESIGFEEMCGAGRITCVEWGSRVAEALPEDRVDLWIEMLSMTAPYVPGEAPRAPRRLRFAGRGDAATRLLAVLADAPGREEGAAC